MTAAASGHADFERRHAMERIIAAPLTERQRMLIGLELEEDQKRDLPSNVYPIAESTLSPLFHPRAICMGEAVVGFTMYQFGNG